MIFAFVWILHLGAARANPLLPPFDLAACSRRLELPSAPDLRAVAIEYGEGAVSDLAILKRSRSAISREMRSSVREAVAIGSMLSDRDYVLFPAGLDFKPELRVDFSWRRNENKIRINEVIEVAGADDQGLDHFVRSALVRGTSLALTISTYGHANLRGADIDPVEVEEALFHPIAPPLQDCNAAAGVMWLIGRSRTQGLLCVNYRLSNGIARILTIHRASPRDEKVYRSKSGQAHGFRDVPDGPLRGTRLHYTPRVQREFEAIGLNPFTLADVARTAPGAVFEQEFGQFLGRSGRHYYEINVLRAADKTWAMTGARAVSLKKFGGFVTLIREMNRAQR